MKQHLDFYYVTWKFSQEILGLSIEGSTSDQQSLQDSVISIS